MLSHVLTAADTSTLSNPVNLTAVGLVTVLLPLVFRTLWRQQGGWESLVNSNVDDARQAREEVREAREDARQAREEARRAWDMAAKAQQAAIEAQAETARYRIRFSTLETQLLRLAEHNDGLRAVLFSEPDEPDGNPSE